jgi:hypothetical protein
MFNIGLLLIGVEPDIVRLHPEKKTFYYMAFAIWGLLFFLSIPGTSMMWLLLLGYWGIIGMFTHLFLCVLCLILIRMAIRFLQYNLSGFQNDVIIWGCAVTISLVIFSPTSFFLMAYNHIALYQEGFSLGCILSLSRNNWLFSTVLMLLVSGINAIPFYVIAQNIELYREIRNSIINQQNQTK